jgi:hypothetical protein
MTKLSRAIKTARIMEVSGELVLGFFDLLAKNN